LRGLAFFFFFLLISSVTLPQLCSFSPPNVNQQTASISATRSAKLGPISVLKYLARM